MEWTLEPISSWFMLQSILVPVAMYGMYPWVMHRMLGIRTSRSVWIVAACAAYAISWYLPSFLIGGENTAFSTHFVGGGLFCALLWMAIVYDGRWQLAWFQHLALLYFLVSGLGVANELFELLLSQTVMPDFSMNDTWWDLLANSLGALVGWSVTYRYYKHKL